MLVEEAMCPHLPHAQWAHSARGVCGFAGVRQIYYWARNWGNAARDVRGSKALFEGTAPVQLQCFDRGEAITFAAAEDGYFTLPEGANSPLRFDRFQSLHHPSVDALLWSAHGQNSILYRCTTRLSNRARQRTDAGITVSIHGPRTSVGGGVCTRSHHAGPSRTHTHSLTHSLSSIALTMPALTSLSRRVCDEAAIR